MDPISFFSTFRSIAEKNTSIYKSVFPLLADFLKKDDQADYLLDFGSNKQHPAQNVQELSKIQGHVIMNPKDFLSEWSYSTVRGALPEIDMLLV